MLRLLLFSKLCQSRSSLRPVFKCLCQLLAGLKSCLGRLIALVALACHGLQVGDGCCLLRYILTHQGQFVSHGRVVRWRRGKFKL